MSTLIQQRLRLTDSFRHCSFLDTTDFPRWQLGELLDLAIQQKNGLIPATFPLEGKSVALVFFNPSLRTRVSMSLAIQKLGGHVVVLEVGNGTWDLEYRPGVVMDAGPAEHIREAAPVLASYVDAIAVRCFPSLEDYALDSREEVLRGFDQHAPVPVLNMESATRHPFQALADIMTIKERFGTVDGRRVTLAWANHPKALPASVANSFALAASQFGMNLTIAAPPEYRLAAGVRGEIEQLAAANGGSVTEVHDLNEGCDGAEVVYAKSWGSLDYYGNWEEEAKLRSRYQDWTIGTDQMQRTDSGVFMHCLPVRRNVVVTDAVLDGPQSIVVDQSANRFHIQKTLLSLLLGD